MLPRPTLRIHDLAAGLPGVLGIAGDADVTSIIVDSRRATKGSLFVCLPGAKRDAYDFIDDAMQAGAVGAVAADANSFQRLGQKGAAVLLVEDTVDACWRLAKIFYGDPSVKLKLVGVTGTNGKTTVAWLLSQILRGGYLGTLGGIGPDLKIDTGLTTPFPPDLNRALAEFVDHGLEFAAMEVSSHALAQRRVDGIEFDVGIFTNLSQDHLDFHLDMEDYFQAKARLFSDLPSTKRLITVTNIDDDFGKRLGGGGAISFGCDRAATIRLIDSSVSLDNIEFQFAYRDRTFRAQVPIGARFNISNCLAVIGGCIALGIDVEDIVEALRALKAAPGRFESVPTGGNFNVIVDYAHTPDALEKLLSAARELTAGRVITVFGCGGDRDRSKRPKMADAASRLSDVVFITSDNPRTEDPLSIIDEIKTGIAPGSEVKIESDRRAAIYEAISLASSRDAVIIAGKGHEDYQILGTEKIHFDDREVAAQAIASRAACV
jgi:UDP-N-acetylmuramoyl-L-alanyl-D-glutamate--2,6-diaminopimelate ligase